MHLMGLAAAMRCANGALLTSTPRVQMIKTAAAKPEQRVQAIMGSMRESGVLSDPTPPGFGMQIQNQMLQARHCFDHGNASRFVYCGDYICRCCGLWRRQR